MVDMPNKAVWSAAALGVSGAYLLNENLKDRRVKQEEEQQRQMYEVQEEKKQRAAAMRQRTGSTATWANGDANADNLSPFFAAMRERWAMMLDDLEILAKSSLGRQKSFKLPLIPSEHNDAAEVVLGALLALGDPGMAEDLQKYSQNPGLALAKLSAASLSLIRGVFERKWPYDISDGDLGGIVQLAIRDDGPQQGEPSMFVLESCKRNISDLAGLVASLGLYIFQEDCFQNKLCGTPPKLRMRFTTASTGWNATGWNGRLYLTNFPNKSFSLPAYQTNQNTWACSYTNVRLESGTSQTCRAPNLERAMYHLATAMAYRTANVAASRLKELEESLLVAKPNPWNQKGLSLEHVAVKACNETELLQILEQSDRTLIEHNQTKICETISSILEISIPFPENPLDTDEVQGPSPALKMEVATFAQEYVQLLNLSYCEVPKFRNKAPSQCVSKSRVTDQAIKGFITAVPPAHHRLRRKYEKNERDRIDRSRSLVTPSPFLTTAFLVGVCRLLLTFLENDSGADDSYLEDAVEGTLPGSVEEVEDFLNLTVQDDAEQDKKNIPATIEDCFQEIEDAVEDCLRYVRGDRIYVEPDQDADDDAETTEFITETAMTTSKMRTGSVSYTFPGYVVVHFDGEPPPPVTVRASLCRPLKDVLSSAKTLELDQVPRSHYQDDSLQEPINSSGIHVGSKGEDDMAEDATATRMPEGSKRKYRSVEEALKEGGWEFVRKKKHICYRRIVKTADDRDQEQHFVMSSTPSDCRSERAALATLHRLDENSEPVLAKTGKRQLRKCYVCQLEMEDICFTKTQLKKKVAIKCKECAATIA
ncbi:hypothetical protein MPSEU_000627900 [Mayamaea pseudoterrestris]|nr:hypothetical protein MPSEU_000627900 [Mayamaea pseudoterrestris]